MNRWWIGSIILGIGAIGLYLAFAEKKRETIVVTPRQVEVLPQPVPSPTPELRPLTEVVDVLDIEPLLDPPAIPRAEGAPAGVVLTAMGEEPSVPVHAISAPATIPLAIE